MAKVYIGLGSNIGNRQQHIKNAIHELKAKGISIIAQSSLIETDPQGGPLQGKYLNGVIAIETNLSPDELLHLTQSIEQKLGRRHRERNGPRTIDLDILLYDQVTLTNSHLTVPHPRMKERDFVLKPLSEIAPEIVKDLFHENH
jgi:2-amino-4-hydroxy-6-hydroxymethyldihydropteridine diphosphokinase